VLAIVVSRAFGTFPPLAAMALTDLLAAGCASVSRWAVDPVADGILWGFFLGLGSFCFHLRGGIRFASVANVVWAFIPWRLWRCRSVRLGRSLLGPYI